MYIETPGARFRPVHVDTVNGEEVSMVVYVGRPNVEAPREGGMMPVDAFGIGTRALTWTDVITWQPWKHVKTSMSTLHVIL